MLADGLNDILEENLRGQRVPMINHGLSIVAVPTVQLHASAALPESVYVSTDAGGTSELILHQVRVMRRGNVIVCQRVRHVLVHYVMGGI